MVRFSAYLLAFLMLTLGWTALSQPAQAKEACCCKPAAGAACCCCSDGVPVQCTLDCGRPSTFQGLAVEAPSPPSSRIHPSDLLVSDPPPTRPIPARRLDWSRAEPGVLPPRPPVASLNIDLPPPPSYLS